jgi:hypothetical protein
MTRLSQRLCLASVAVLISALTAPAFAETIGFTATLSAAEEAPPTDSKGTGKVEATYDTETSALAWTIEYADLSGPVTAAQFRRPPAAGNTAPPILEVTGDLTSPIRGTATLSEDQMKGLTKGRWFFNLYTAKFPAGEIGGEVKKAQ